MTSVQDFLSLATTLVSLGLVVAAVMKMFQIATDLQEMKEILKEIRRGAELQPVPVPRAVAAQFAADPAPSMAALQSRVAEPEAPLPPPPPAPSNGPGLAFTTPPTAEELVRAIHAQDFRGDDFPL